MIFTCFQEGPCLVYAAAASAKSLQLCPTLCNPIDGSPPGSPVPGILQARTLEWVIGAKQNNAPPNSKKCPCKSSEPANTVTYMAKGFL